MKIKCMIEETKYRNKPQGKQIGLIQNNMHKTEITIKDLANRLLEGCSFKPALLTSKGDESWVSQQLIALDFDNNTTINDELNRCKEFNMMPAFGYTSFSHTEEHHKFRLVFCLSECVCDKEIIIDILNVFKQLFINADINTFSISKLFFGGKSLICEGYDNVLHINDININAVNTLSENRMQGEHINKYNNNTYICVPTLSSDINYNIQAIKEGNIEYLQNILSPSDMLFENQQEFYNYITQEINLFHLLGLEGSPFKCIFHNDNNPSAGIFISNKNQYFYMCHSDKCSFKGNIIRCIERLRGCTRPQAINFVKQVYKLDIKDTDWQKEQKDILEENKRMIREGELEEYYPEIYKVIKRYESLIYVLHDVAKDNVYDEKYSDSDGNTVFFTSLKSIASKLGLQSHNKTTDRVALLSFLQMLNKLPESEIPEKYLSKAKEIAIKYDKRNIVNFYSIPSYCDTTLDISNKRAKLFLDNNITMKGWSRELLYRTFGEEITNEVYPQFTKAKITDKSEERAMQIHKITIDKINEKGCVLEKEIVEELRSVYGKVKTEIQIKKCLQEMLDAYDLKRVKSNKKLKEKYNMDTKGYPFIIFKNED